MWVRVCVSVCIHMKKIDEMDKNIFEIKSLLLLIECLLFWAKAISISKYMMCWKSIKIGIFHVLSQNSHLKIK